MPHRWNAYIETPEHRYFQRCVNCGTRSISGLYHEVYDLAKECNGQCRDDCCHGWGYACQTCTVAIATSCLDRLHEQMTDAR